MPSVSPVPWEMKTEIHEEETRVSFSGHNVTLDVFDTDALQDRLFQIVEVSGHNHIVLDLANVIFLTSTTLGVLLQVHKRLHSGGGQLTLVNVQPQIYEIFTLTKLNRVLDIHSR